MSWGCYKHECDVDAPGWLEKEAELCDEHSLRDDGATWGSRQIGICPWCVEELLEEVVRLRAEVTAFKFRERAREAERHEPYPKELGMIRQD